MIDRRALLVSALAAPSVLAAGSAGAAPQAITVPFAMPRDKPYMLIGINGKGPYRFTMDTGAAGTMAMRFDLVQQLGLRDYDVRHSVGVVGEAQATGLFAADEVNFGGVFKQRHVAISGLGEGEKRRRAGYDGLLPAPFFIGRESEIDFEQRQVRLYLDGAPDRAGFRPVRYIPQNHDQIVVEARFNDIPCRMQVDTGAEGGVILGPRFVARNHLWDAFPKHLDGGVQGVTGGATSREVKAPSFAFGPYRFPDALTTMINPDATSYLEEDGLIGIDILRRFTLSFDGPGSVLWLKPNSAIGEAFRTDRAGLGFRRHAGREGAVVDYVAPGAAADHSGLRVGDVLVEIQTQALADELRWRMSGPPGERIPLKVQRGNEARDLEMALVLEDRL